MTYVMYVRYVCMLCMYVMYVMYPKKIDLLGFEIWHYGTQFYEASHDLHRNLLVVSAVKVPMFDFMLSTTHSSVSPCLNSCNRTSIVVKCLSVSKFGSLSSFMNVLAVPRYKLCIVSMAQNAMGS